jgi:hypothetical protein
MSPVYFSVMRYTTPEASAGSEAVSERAGFSAASACTLASGIATDSRAAAILRRAGRVVEPGSGQIMLPSRKFIAF